jgi:hypothetical protein
MPQFGLQLVDYLQCFYCQMTLMHEPKKLADIALERIEVLKHKWLESEKAGYDIGMETAKKSWKKSHAKKWKASRRKLLN